MAEAQHNRSKTMKKLVDDESGEVTFEFTSGQTIKIGIGELSDDVRRRATLHGLAQKIGDAAAGKKDDEAFEACMVVYQRLVTGEWKVAAERGEGARPLMVIQAIFNALTAAGKNPDLAAIQAKYTGEGAEERRKAAMANPQVKAEFAKLQAAAAAERAAKLTAAAEGNAPDLDSI